MTIVKVSPKGQITLPKKMRDHFKTSAFVIDVSEKTIILRPLTIEKAKRDEDENFGMLSESALSFWNDPEEDIWDEFYKDIPSL